MTLPPIENTASYNQSVKGFFGEFGAGANAQIFFLQSAINGPDLDKIALVSDLPGSEQWSVRDLFQRDVDQERVNGSIIPYFQDTGKVKFFNPLTLTMLPVDEVSMEVQSEMPSVKTGTVKLDERDWEYIEAPGLYRARFMAGHQQYGVFEWNDRRIKIVAIDGQHRLSALKRLSKSNNSTISKEEFNSWSIPIVLFSLRALDTSKRESTVLEIIRNIFVYINTAAKTPNETRQILLTDESINSVCTQEVLDYAHSNDVKKRSDRDLQKIPLLFFDWRGAESDNKMIASPGALKSNVEIRDWLKHYILGDDFSADQKSTLGITPNHPLHQAFARSKEHRKLSVKESGLLRELFNEAVLPGLMYFLENYAPLKNYITRLRTIEHESCEQGTDVTEYAFHKLRFGSHQGGDDIKDQIDVAYKDILRKIQLEIQSLPALIGFDIGMRGVMYAYGYLRRVWVKYTKPKNPNDWLEYSKWFTKNINQAYDHGWLHNDEPKVVSDHLDMVVVDHAGTTINYRIIDAHSALGAMLSIVVASIGFKGKLTDAYEFVKEDLTDKLSDTVLKGYKKQARVLLKDKYPMGGKDLLEAVNKRAQASKKKHIDKFIDYADNLNEEA